MPRRLPLILSALGLALWAGLSGCGADRPNSSVPGAASGAVAADLKGKLVQVVGGQPVEAAIAGDPDYYVIYHSASW